jgi:hypothetical protein
MRSPEPGGTLRRCLIDGCDFRRSGGALPQKVRFSITILTTTVMAAASRTDIVATITVSRQVIPLPIYPAPMGLPSATIQYGGATHIAMPAPASTPSAKTAAPMIALETDTPLGRFFTMPARITRGAP